MKNKMVCESLEYLDMHINYAYTTRAHTSLQQAMRLHIINIHSGPLQILHEYRNPCISYKRLILIRLTRSRNQAPPVHCLCINIGGPVPPLHTPPTLRVYVTN
jgi:hypothetical protein